MYGGNANPSASAPGAAGAANQRYNYLVGRLRSRQITMEEATELFALMQGMIARANEVARAATYRTPTPSVPAVVPPPPPSRLPGAPSSADDFLLVGLLAMGAGAGLLAALSKRIGDVTPAAPDRSKSGSASR